MKFSTKITLWYQKNKRNFPWRESKDPYKIWLSEIILQQTRTAQGLPYYISFTKHFPTVFDLAKADENDILKLWQGLGYYSRARNLHFAAKYIVNELDGVFPENYKDLLSLKGVGDYTASAIASISYNEKCAVVDGNVYRVLARYFGIDTPINSGKGIKEFKSLATALLPKNHFGLHNQAIMDFGAMICTPKKADCDHCIFNDSCVALKEKKVAELPVKTSKIKIRKRYFNYIVLLSDNNNISINKRTGKGIWQNLYEFPLIETASEINKNELMKNETLIQLVSDIKKVELFNSKQIIHKLSHQHLHTKFWIIFTDEKIADSIPLKNIQNYPFPTLINNFISEFEV